MDATITESARAPALEALRVNVIVGRARARLSQDELAKRASVSRQTISRIERAATDVGIDVVDRIATALGTTVSELLVPFGPDRVDDEELARRAAAPREESIDARALLAAVDEAAGRPAELERFSRAGRPPVHGRVPSASR
jgi:transcriptional regulator with XRE-family HTH domain